MRKKSPVTVPPKASEINDRSLLFVEWTEGTRHRKGVEPRVLIDGEEVGHIDDKIFLLPGNYQVSVRRGRHMTPASSYNFFPGQAIVLEYQSQLTPIVVIPILGAILTYLLIPIVIAELPDVSPKLVSGVLSAAFLGLLILAEHYGLPVYHVERLKQRSDSPFPLAEVFGKGRRGSSLARTGRLLVNLSVDSSRSPSPMVYVDGKRLGPTADIAELPAGRHLVQVRGFLDRSSGLSIEFEPGELIELEVRRTRAGMGAMVALAIPPAAAIIGVVKLDTVDWTIPILATGGVLGCAAALLITRLSPTLELYMK